MLSVRVKSWIRRKLEEWMGEYSEDGSPPDRLRLEVLSFAEMYPNATRGQFVDFAARFAGECWRAGYIRGVEWAERDPDEVAASPEQLADKFDPEWRWRPAGDLNLEGVVPEERTDEEAMMEQIALFKRPKK